MMHFDLQVNNEAISTIWVLRILRPDDGDGWHTYRWSVYHHDPRTNRLVGSGSVLHRESDGIEALASQVLNDYLASLHVTARP